MFEIENILSYYRCVFTKPDDDELSKKDGQTADGQTYVQRTVGQKGRE